MADGELDIATKARLFDTLVERIDVVRKRYDEPLSNTSFNSVFSNGVLAGLRIVEADLENLHFEIDSPHPLTDVGHLTDDRNA